MCLVSKFCPDGAPAEAKYWKVQSIMVGAKKELNSAVRASVSGLLAVCLRSLHNASGDSRSLSTISPGFDFFPFARQKERLHRLDRGAKSASENRQVACHWHADATCYSALAHATRVCPPASYLTVSHFPFVPFRPLPLAAPGSVNIYTTGKWKSLMGGGWGRHFVSAPADGSDK